MLYRELFAVLEGITDLVLRLTSANGVRRRRVVRSLLAIALTRELGLDALLFARLQIERMPLDLFDDVFLQNFSLETAESALNRFAVMDVDFRQLRLPLFPLSLLLL
jgi:hypothetical protein